MLLSLGVAKGLLESTSWPRGAETQLLKSFQIEELIWQNRKVGCGQAFDSGKNHQELQNL